jgi:hypothetical protein
LNQLPSQAPGNGREIRKRKESIAEEEKRRGEVLAEIAADEEKLKNLK